MLAAGLVTSETPGSDDYFPERTLARWLRTKQLDPVVYTILKAGVRPVRMAYQVLREHPDLDAIVLVDGGTDILMRGDEVGLGTPAEDLTSVAPVLENIAEIDSAGGYLGAFSVPRTSYEGTLFLDAVGYANGATPEDPSIVNGSIAAAIRGEFGDVRFTDRTANSELFINPLMSLYFGFDLDAIAHNCRYLPLLEGTEMSRQVLAVIESYWQSADLRAGRLIPH